jgi:hypothetical protein
LFAVGAGAAALRALHHVGGGVPPIALHGALLAPLEEATKIGVLLIVWDRAELRARPAGAFAAFGLGFGLVEGVAKSLRAWVVLGGAGVLEQMAYGGGAALTALVCASLVSSAASHAGIALMLFVALHRSVRGRSLTLFAAWAAVSAAHALYNLGIQGVAWTVGGALFPILAAGVALALGTLASGTALARSVVSPTRGGRRPRVGRTTTSIHRN